VRGIEALRAEPERVQLPDEEGLDARPDGAAYSTQQEALFAALEAELSGDFERMRSIMMDGSISWDSELYEAARFAMMVRAVNAQIDPEGPVAAWLQAVPEPAHPLSRWLLSELRARANVDAHILNRETGYPALDGIGSPSSWRVAGVVSPYQYAGFERDYGAVSSASLDQHFSDIAVDTQVIPADGTRATFSTPNSGVGFAEAFFDTPEGFDGVLVAEGAAPVRIYIDDTLVAEYPTKERWESDLLMRRVKLPAGSHRVLVQYGTGGNYRMNLRLLSNDTREVTNFSADVREWAEGSNVEIGDAPNPYATRFLPDATTINDPARLALAELIRVTGASAESQALYMAFNDKDHPFVQMRRADLAFWMDTVPSTEREELALSALPEDPSWPMLQLMRAYRIDAAGKGEESLLLLERAAAGAPGSALIQFGYAKALRDEGWQELAEPILERLVDEHPDRCDIISSLLSMRLSRGEAISPSTTPELWHRCYDVQVLFYEHYHMPREQYADALNFAIRAASWNPTQAGGYSRWIRTARAMEDPRELNAARETAIDNGVEPEELMMPQVDESVASNDPGQAAEILAAFVELQPASVSAAMAQLAIEGAEPFEELRMDGEEIVANYQSEEHGYEGPVVYVHDYLAHRFFEDGSSVEVVHQIMQLRTRDALGDYGEMGIPRDARLLTARVIKADGTTISPPSIPQKDSISMPNLEIGDFVELEWLTTGGARPWPEMTYTAPRFFFEILDAPLHHSVATYEIPDAWSEYVDFDMRNFEGDKLEEQVDGRTRHTFSVRNSPMPHREPSSPPSAEWLPSIRLTIDYTWEDVVEQYSNFVLPQVAGDRRIRELAARLARESDGPKETVRRIFRYVNDDIVSQGGYFSTSAAQTVQMKEGDRMSALWALLEAAGFEPSLALARTVPSDQTETEAANPDAYSASLIRVKAGGETLWLDPVLDYAPFNYIEPVMQDIPAYLAVGKDAGTRTRTPQMDDAKQRSVTSVTLQLREDGSATGSVTEEVPLSQAPGFLSFLRYVESERQLVQALEQQLAGSFPGATVSSLEFEGTEDYASGITIRYELEVPNLAVPQGDALVVQKAPFALSLAQVYAGYSEREHALVVSTPSFGELHLRFELPDGYVTATEVSGEQLSYKSNQYSREVRSTSPGVLEWKRDVSVPIQRVSPDKYDDFATFIRRIDSAEDLTLRFRRGADDVSEATEASP
jgi:tetratricopeptide (TPR) repeat protein